MTTAVAECSTAAQRTHSTGKSKRLPENDEPPDLFETNAVWLGLRRGRYLRDYALSFIRARRN